MGKDKRDTRLVGFLSVSESEATSDEHDDKAAKSSDKPMMGSVRVPCKNKECSAVVESGFVWNMKDWVTGFSRGKRTCPLCKQTAEYSRDDVEYLPSES